ncbi:MAG: preprotein translocase subunit SecA, partial [Bacteroidales bacterium]|nr:preprotein translocase subunit SecA [Bacteroidales bacterium]
RMFGSDRIAKIMDRLGVKEGEVIQHSMITKSIERAQKKVEENNFGIRKRLLQYDDVMNSQREVIYKKRRNALFGDRLAVDISNMMYDVGEQMINQYQEEKDFDGFKLALLKNLAIESPFTANEFFSLRADAMADTLYEAAYEHYRDKSKRIADSAYPVIQDVYVNQPQFENIAIPITDGTKTMNVIANLKKSYDNGGKEIILSIEKGITLSMIDDAWKEHLREMDDLKQSVQNAAYEQKDPLLIYKFEAFELFKKMIVKINEEITSFLVRGRLPLQDASSVREARAPRGIDRTRMREERRDLLAQSHSDTQANRPNEPQRREIPKIGRNDKVKVQYNDGRILEAKFKAVEHDLNRGNCQIVN